jgi:hypothetical protein
MHRELTFADSAYVGIKPYGLADLFGDDTSVHDPSATSASMPFLTNFCKIRANIDLVATPLEVE